MIRVTDARLRIGPFSRASFLSIKALRAYHERGILVPAAVDEDTGYRVYEAAQLLDAAVLKRLRDLDVPLEQIRAVLDARDPHVTERVLTQHAALMQQRLAETARIIDELQRGIDAPSLHTPVHVRDEPHRHAMFVDGRVDEASFSTFLDGAFATLVGAYEWTIGPMTEPAGGLYPNEIVADLGEDVSAFVRLPGDRVVSAPAGVRVGELPAVRVAVAIHVGSYDTVGDTYRQLGAWVAANGEPADERVREIYVIGPPESEDDYRTEIHWPITRA